MSQPLQQAHSLFIKSKRPFIGGPRNRPLNSEGLSFQSKRVILILTCCVILRYRGPAPTLGKMAWLNDYGLRTKDWTYNLYFIALWEASKGYYEAPVLWQLLFPPISKCVVDACGTKVHRRLGFLEDWAHPSLRLMDFKRGLSNGGINPHFWSF